MKLYIIVHSNQPDHPGGWNASYMGGVEIVQAFTSIEDAKKFLGFHEGEGQASAMRKAWNVVEVDLEKSTPIEL